MPKRLPLIDFRSLQPESFPKIRICRLPYAPAIGRFEIEMTMPPFLLQNDCAGMRTSMGLEPQLLRILQRQARQPLLIGIIHLKCHRLISGHRAADATIIDDEKIVLSGKRIGDRATLEQSNMLDGTYNPWHPPAAEAFCRDDGLPGR